MSSIFMRLSSKRLLVSCICLGLCTIVSSQGQDYIYTGQAGAPYAQIQNHQYINPSDIIPFRQTPAGFHPSAGSYFHQDLQTSDIPAHLQQTLPQYRFTTSPPQVFNFQGNHPFSPFGFPQPNQRDLSSPSGFRADQFKPTTLRPNYSHLFARHHDPSQTETFLGQITLQNPVDAPPKFDDYKGGEYPEERGEAIAEKSRELTSNGFGEVPDDNRSNSIPLASRPSFLNHRTRIVAPDTSRETSGSQVSNYFVNTNGDVTLTTASPFVPTPTTTGMSPGLKSNRSKKEYVPKSVNQKSTNLEPLLEEPLKDNYGTNNDDEVEVIESKEQPATTTQRLEERKHDESNSSQTPTAVQDLTTSTEDEEINQFHTHQPESAEYESEEHDIYGLNDIRHEDYQDETEESSLENLKQEHNVTSNKTFEEVISTQQPPKAKDKNRADKIPDTTEYITEVETTTVPISISMSSSVRKGDRNEKIIPVNDTAEPELVISIVTSKTVINSTVVGSVTPNPGPSTHSVTEAAVGDKAENSTDTWVVVASVQTSRSVSGARYLPSSVVEQDVRVKLLNEHSYEDTLNQTSSSIETDPTDSKDHLEDSEENTSEEEQEDEETTTEATTVKTKTSTESLIDKLDQFQSDLSGGLLTGGLGNNIAVIKENSPDKIDMTTMEDLTTSTTTKAPKHPPVNIRKFSPANRPTTTKRPRRKPYRKPFDVNQLQGDQPQKKTVELNSFLPPGGYKLNASDDKSSKLLEEILSRVKPKMIEKEEKKEVESVVKVAEEKEQSDQPDNSTDTGEKATAVKDIFKFTQPVDISKFLPPGYKLPKDEDSSESSKEAKVDDKLAKDEETNTESGLFKNTKADDISKFLPPGYKLPKSEEKSTESSSIFKNTKADDLSKFLPPGYKLPKLEGTSTESSSIFKNTKADDLSKFLPPGYKLPKSDEKTTESASILRNTKADDVSKFLPPGFKIPKYKESSTEGSIYKNTKADDLSKFLPPGYKARTTTEKADEAENPIKGLVPQPVDISAFLPPGYKDNSTEDENPTSNSTNSSPMPSSKPSGGSKLVFPSRPGGGPRKSATRTTPKSVHEEHPKGTVKPIQKGWPSRATTEFTGWPTPSTTPISIEKLLEAARTASTTTTNTPETTVSSTTTTTTTTTTTPKPTTPGVCVDECDLVGTIKLVAGVKWAPELLDRNTREWQVLANEVESQLEYVYSSSSRLNKWYKKIRIDGFSEGSVLVDYLVELNEVGRKVDTQEMKNLFHESLDDALTAFGASNREAKSLNESMKLEGKLSLGNFVVDPAYTDFLVLPKQAYPTVGYAENDVLLPQWAIAVIVIGLASLLFVIIFGVTVLVNRQKNAKKEEPYSLTEDMLNELNKNHMGGFENYGADDLYNMEDVWNDRGYEQKAPPKKRSSGSIHDNSMSNLYDSWRSEWNGYYYNAYYGNSNNPGSSHSGYNGRRRSDYDTNF